MTEIALGHDNRLYLEMVPDDESREQIIDVIGSLALDESAQPVQPEKLHLTVIHFGKVDEVYDELCTVVPDLSQKQYLDELQIYVDKCEDVLPENSEVRSAGFSLFGMKQDTLVWLTDEHPDLDRAHERALRDLRDFFTACGVKDVELFMGASQNFQFALKFNPHITLAKNVDTLPGDVPRINLRLQSAGLNGL